MALIIDPLKLLIISKNLNLSKETTPRYCSFSPVFVKGETCIQLYFDNNYQLTDKLSQNSFFVYAEEIGHFIIGYFRYPDD